MGKQVGFAENAEREKDGGKKMRLIDADALESKLRTLIKRITLIEESRDMFYHDSGMNGATTGAILEVKNAPTIDPASLRKKGEWGKRENGKPKCSVCGEYHLYAWPDYKNCNFCPNCGCDMRGETHDS